MSLIKNIKKIGISQKKILIFALLIVCGFSATWFLAYIPAQKKIDQLSGDLKNIEDQIKQIEAMVDQDKKMGEGIKLLEERHRALSLKFPSREEDALTALFDLASKRNIEIVSIKSQAKISCRQDMSIDGKKCYEIPLSLTMKGNYKDFVDYIDLLRESLPAFITFDKLRIVRQTTGALMLEISLEIRLYLLIGNGIAEKR